MEKWFPMPSLMGPPFREAATIHVDAAPAEVTELLARPGFLRALDHRLPASRELTLTQEKDRVQVHDQEGHLHLAFRIAPEKGGSRIAALETVRPRNPVEAGLHALFPKRQHEALVGELDRLKDLVEATAQPA